MGAPTLYGIEEHVRIPSSAKLCHGPHTPPIDHGNAVPTLGHMLVSPWLLCLGDTCLCCINPIGSTSVFTESTAWYFWFPKSTNVKFGISESENYSWTDIEDLRSETGFTVLFTLGPQNRPTRTKQGPCGTISTGEHAYCSYVHALLRKRRNLIFDLAYYQKVYLR